MMDSFDDIIFAPATSVGSGAVSIIRISGPDCLSLVDNLVDFKHGNASSAAGYTVKFGTITGLDDVLVSIFRAPHSYTGEDSAEISCHASPYIVSRIMELLSEHGGRVAEPGEFTRRAFLSGKMDLAQAEAVADLIASTSAAAHRVALNQLRGGYSAVMKELRERLLKLTALLELELDFSEEDVEFADRGELSALLDECISRVSVLAASFRDGNALRKGVPVAIVGAPNCGKSTLLNALLRDDRAIVSEIAGTTRDTIEETVTIGGILFRFIDTAGIRRSSDRIESLGIERSFAAVDKADIVLAVVDTSQAAKCSPVSDSALVNKSVLSAEYQQDKALELISSRMQDWQQLIVLENKSDLVGNADFTCELSNCTPLCLKISAKYGTGIDKLREILANSQLNRFSESDTVVTNARHHSVLVEALDALRAARSGLSSGLPTVLISEHLRQALATLGSITGEISTDEVLGEIFGKFCIGK